MSAVSSPADVHVDAPCVVLGHGAGGLLSHRLISDVFARRFAHAELEILDDAACLAFDSDRLVMSTDGFIVDPLFFPGGDIGKLAITGTVNDVAMLGAQPMYVSFGILIEDGFAIAELDRIAESVARTARGAGVAIVTGDTKVLPHGAADGVYIHTTGVGRLLTPHRLSGRGALPGDHILVSGPVGDHGATIMAARAGLDAGALRSDCTPLVDLVASLMHELPTGSVHTLRDPTRGGLASALNEIATSSGVELRIREESIPVRDETSAACEILGLDPYYLACEGRLAAIVDGGVADQALDVMRAHPDGSAAALIGTVEAATEPCVILETRVGGHRALDLLAGEPLPRIC